MFPKVFSLFLNSVKASLFFTKKGRLFHNILPLKPNEFIPKRYDFTYVDYKVVVFQRSMTT